MLSSAEPITLRLAVSDMKEGIQYLKGQKAIMAIISAALFINFFFTPVTGNFIPYFIRTDLKSAPAYLFDSVLKPELWSSVFCVCVGASSLIGAVMMIPIASVLAGAALQAFGSTVLLVICAAGFTITAVLLLTNRHIKSL